MNKLIKGAFVLGGIALVIGVGDACASHMELIAPVKEKGAQFRDMIKTGFGILASVALMVQIGRGVTSQDPAKKSAMFVSAAWITGGAIAIYNFPRVLALVGVEI